MYWATNFCSLMIETKKAQLLYSLKIIEKCLLQDTRVHFKTFMNPTDLDVQIMIKQTHKLAFQYK